MLANYSKDLGPSATGLLIEEYPQTYQELVRGGLSDESCLRLLEKKLPSYVAEAMYWSCGGEVLARAARQETRKGGLWIIMRRGLLGGDLQAALSRKKLHPDIVALMADRGVTFDAAQMILNKNDNLDGKTTVNLLDPWYKKMDAATVLRALENLSWGPFHQIASFYLAGRPDVRELATKEGSGTLLEAVAAIHLNPQEQEALLGRVDDLSLGAVAALLDRPTTVKSVRHTLWSRFEKELARSGWGVPAPDVWPEVASLSDLQEPWSTLLLERGRIAPWGGSRSLQVLELLAAGHDNATVMAHLWEGTRSSCDLHATAFWLEPYSHLLSGGLSSAWSWYESESKGRRARIARAEAEQGVLESEKGPRVGGMPREPEVADGGMLVRSLLHSRKGRSAAASFLGEQLGDNLEAWRVAFNLLSDFPGTVEELAKVAQATSNS